MCGDAPLSVPRKGGTDKGAGRGVTAPGDSLSLFVRQASQKSSSPASGGAYACGQEGDERMNIED